MKNFKYEELTREIIGASHAVHNSLGCGFIEKVYHNALVIELENRGLSVEAKKKMAVNYDDKLVGEFFADVVVDGKVIVEVKAVDKLKGLFEAQLLNYLKASGMDVGLIINFGPSVTVKRMVR